MRRISTAINNKEQIKCIGPRRTVSVCMYVSINNWRHMYCAFARRIKAETDLGKKKYGGKKENPSSPPPEISTSPLCARARVCCSRCCFFFVTSRAFMPGEKLRDNEEALVSTRVTNRWHDSINCSVCRSESAEITGIFPK